MLDFVWKLNAVTIAAQILTLPISIYHFHQFPNYFLLTNFVAVPLSSFILLDEILLCAVSFIPPVAAFVGKILSWLIWIMNSYVERIEMLPFTTLSDTCWNLETILNSLELSKINPNTTNYNELTSKQTRIPKTGCHWSP
jgi:competence protein ComEC